MAEITEQEAIAIIDAQLQQGQRHFTLTEAAAITGLSMDTVRHAMDTLLTRYTCRLQASEQGDLIYHFGATLQRRGEKTAAERRQEWLNRLWRLFTVVYKAWIAVTLVVYFVVFLVIVIAVVVASMAQPGEGNNRRRRHRGSAMPLGGIFELFFSIFRWHTITGAMTYQRDRDGYAYRHYESRPAVLNPAKKNFIAAVYDFVFGPPRVELDSLTNEREVASYLLQQKGLVVTAELSALAGWTLPQAETFLADCAVRYRGELKISETSDQAVLYGQFDDIMRGVGAVETGAITHYWDEYEPEYEWTGNSSMRNLILIVMNGFNLLMALFVVSGGVSALIQPRGGRTHGLLSSLTANEMLVTVVLGWVPMVFSILFFLVPLLRGVKLSAWRRQRHQQNIRKRLFKAIFDRRGLPQTVLEVVAAVNTSTTEETLGQAVVESQLKELVLDLAGDMDAFGAAEVRYSFPRVTTELDEVQRLRANRRVGGSLGDMMIESDN